MPAIDIGNIIVAALGVGFGAYYWGIGGLVGGILGNVFYYGFLREILFGG